MCFACTGNYWPWNRPIEVAPPPSKEEEIFLDPWTDFYPDYRQGIHPAGPVYQGQGYGIPGMYPYGGGAMYGGSMPQHYMSGVGGGHFPYAGGFGGHPHMLPMPMCPASMTSQAAQAAAANKSLANMAGAPNYFVGATPAEVAMQQAVVASTMGQVMGSGNSLAPYKPSDGQQFWCKELDSTWTLRTYSTIALGDVSPGHWERHALSGYFFWVRQPG